ncbi:MAG: hypothetical protein GEV11_02570 [Streptosporangiales bacterium]|nr:hypothetical protein [Streptosporangiales bacterium]
MLLGANVVLTALVTTLLVGAGMPVGGSLAWGLVAGCAGLLGTSMTAVAAQLVSAPRTATIGAFGLFFVMYLFRGAAELSAPWLGWLVPNGWLLRAGLLRERDGAAAGPRWLGSPLGLAWRLQRGALVAWAAAAAAFGLALGFGTQGAIDGFARSEALSAWSARMGGGDAADVFFGLIVYIFGAYSVAMCVLLITSRLWQEESAGTAEMVLAGPVGGSGGPRATWRTPSPRPWRCSPSSARCPGWARATYRDCSR